MPGQGAQVGPLRPDYGDGWADLKCDQCGATWTGPLGEVCSWCIDAEERQRQWQAELVLRKPDVDRDDKQYDGAMRAWAERMNNAVKAGLVTKEKVLMTWEKAMQ